MNKQKLFEEAHALLKHAQALLLAARAKHERHAAATLKKVA